MKTFHQLVNEVHFLKTIKAVTLKQKYLIKLVSEYLTDKQEIDRNH